MSESRYFLDNFSFFWTEGHLTEQNKTFHSNTMITINIYYCF